jgi:pyrroloquinoline quinone biosynthesis protein A
MWTTPAATEMRFGFEVTMYVMNKQSALSNKKPTHY